MRVFLAAILLAPLFASAHGTGASYEAAVGEYFVDIGYDTLQPIAGDRIVLDFNLFTKEREPADFDYAWVRLMHGGATLLATGIDRAELGGTSLLYALPEGMEGELTVNVRFHDEGVPLAETAFSIPVAPAQRSLGNYLPLAISALIGGAGIGSILLFTTRIRRQ